MISEETAYSSSFYHQCRACIPSYVVIITFVSPFGKYFDSKMVSNEGSQTSAKYWIRSSLDSWCLLLFQNSETNPRNRHNCPMDWIPNYRLYGRHGLHVDPFCVIKLSNSSLEKGVEVRFEIMAYGPDETVRN